MIRRDGKAGLSLTRDLAEEKLDRQAVSERCASALDTLETLVLELAGLGIGLEIPELHAAAAKIVSRIVDIAIRKGILTVPALERETRTTYLERKRPLGEIVAELQSVKATATKLALDARDALSG